jgi:hypothetical protein
VWVENGWEGRASSKSKVVGCPCGGGAEKKRSPETALSLDLGELSSIGGVIVAQYLVITCSPSSFSMYRSYLPLHQLDDESTTKKKKKKKKNLPARDLAGFQCLQSLVSFG